MKAENAKKQADLLMEVINKLSEVSSKMFESCQLESIGKPTSEANEYYNSEYKGTQETIYNLLQIAANRYYELNQIK